MAQRSVPENAWRAARRFVTDPRTVGVARAAPRTVAFVARSWAASREHPGQAPGPPSIGMAAQVLLDEVLISAMRNPKLFPHGDDYRRAGEDVHAASRLWADRGWLDDPERYHVDPGAPEGAEVIRERSFDQRYEHLIFPSRYAPHDGEPGRDRWMSHVPNRLAHAYVLRHAEPGRPWLICVHGFGMGRPAMDLRAFRAHHLHWDLGLNLLLPVLPMHGPRQDPGAQPGEGFMSVDLLDSIHGMAQAAFDVRTAIRWIHATGGEAPVGVYGISLGGFVASLVASLEPGLACAIAGIPATDMPDLYRRHSPPDVRRRALAAGALGPEADAVHSVVAPLILEPKLPRERLYVFAGAGDRMSTSRQARRLWEHWGRPRMAWYPGGHVGFFLAGSVSRFVADALTESGLVSPISPGSPGEPGAAGPSPEPGLPGSPGRGSPGAVPRPGRPAGPSPGR
jgi:dienelactone hydrolase